MKLKPHEHDVLARAPAHPQATYLPRSWWARFFNRLHNPRTRHDH